jgi:hypothetical protein
MDKPKPERTVRIPERFVKNKMIKMVGTDAYAVFNIIVLHARWSGDNAGEAWPTFATIRELTGIRQPNITEAVRKLEGYGYIKVEKRKKRRKDGSEYGHKRNHYTVSHLLANRKSPK